MLRTRLDQRIRFLPDKHYGLCFSCLLYYRSHPRCQASGCGGLSSPLINRQHCYGVITRSRPSSERNRLIYKRECQGKYSSLDRKRGTFLAFQPLSAMRDARLCCLAPLSLGSCNCSISAAASLLVATTPIYKRECQGKYSSLDRKRGTFLAFQKIFLPRPEERNFSCLPAPVR